MDHRDERNEWVEPDMEALTASDSRADDVDVAMRNGNGPITIIVN